MKTVLTFLVDHFDFLWRRGDYKTGYRIVASRPGEAVLLESESLRISVAYHRQEWDILLEPVCFKRQYGWISSHAIYGEMAYRILNDMWDPEVEVTPVMVAQMLEERIAFFESMTPEGWKEFKKQSGKKGWGIKL
ncbi:MAG: hypothetical protein Q4C87_10740 [Actinomycetaceae bacterium]|nr:hypothetical protein [Actinomycetaceae bacterium]